MLWKGGEMKGVEILDMKREEVVVNGSEIEGQKSGG